MTNQPTIAYFSAEYAIADDLPIYAGGLGILAADTLMQAGADGRPWYSVGLVYHEAFTGHETDGRTMVQRLKDDGFALATDENGQTIHVTIQVEDRAVDLQLWTKSFGSAKLILLDARVETNHLRDRAICDHLYASDAHLQMAQEIAIGFGGVAALDTLGLQPDIYHLNEGHMAMGAVALAYRYAAQHPDTDLASALQAVRAHLRASKHTILSAAGLVLDPETIHRLLGVSFAKVGWKTDGLVKIAAKADGNYSDTKLLMATAQRASGVSKIHVWAEHEAHSQSQLIALTNGVYAARWRAHALGDHVLKLDDQALWQAHEAGRHQLIKYVAQQTETILDPNRLTVVWARRMTGYKRPELLVTDLERLARIAGSTKRPVQFIVSGQANPADANGIALMNQVIAAADQPDLHGRFAYLPHYNPASARLLVQGADVWLNTPIRPQEACGTSGMKASLNGALQFSTSDGWIDEVDIDPIGWQLADENSAESLYDTLEQKIAPLFYDDHEAWLVKMRANIQLIEQQFTTSRMLADYYAKLYT